MNDIKDYTRVTECLYPLSGLKCIPAEILNKAAIRGQKAHDACSALMMDIGLLDIDEDIQGYVKSFEQWMPKNFLELPERFFCDVHGITGQVDGLYAEGDDLVLFDIKTPVKPSNTWMLQLSAYAYLARLAGYPITAIEVVRLNKDGKAPEVIRYKEDFDLFLDCLNVYRYFYDGKEQENYLDYL
jgi:hypothetical protein